jgi:anti-sigma B factor antagonist
MSVGYYKTFVGSHLVKLNGPLNARQSEVVRQLFRDMAADGIRRVVVDLEDVLFIDSSGLAALLAGFEVFGSKPQNFRLTGIQDQPRLVFELTGLDFVFQTLLNIQVMPDFCFTVPVSRYAALEHLAA